MNSSGHTRSSKAVANWLLIGVGMLLIQVILGGITRLTGSGLSITEWNIITGALPPVSENQWLVEFDKYRQTPQFHLLNADFGLRDFKFIFFWEWFHRLWARLIGVVFIVGFLWLLWKKKMTREMIRPFIILFLLGALQGAVGWIMVASGLTGDAIYVKPTRLALHFIFALCLVAYTFWFALELLVPAKEIIRNTRIRKWTWVILFVLFFQLLYGALMAGNKAATIAPTWPTINGDWFPDNLFRTSPLLINFIENTLTIQFTHRFLAYGLLLLVSAWTIIVFRTVSPSAYLTKIRFLPIGLLVFQVLLGITALLVSPGIVPNHWVLFDWVAQVHQVTGLLFLLTMTGVLFLVRPGFTANT